MSKEHVVYQKLDRKILEENVKRLVTQEIVEEHARNPFGQHSDALERILIYLRKHQLRMQGKYVIVCTQPHQKWCIGELSGVRGVPPQIYEKECFTSIKEAEHYIFLRRLKEFGLIHTLT